MLDTASMTVSILQRVEPEMAAAQFWFFFLSGSGALGIAGAQVPKISKTYDSLKVLGDSDLTLGGEDLCTPFGYPTAVKTKDIEQVIASLTDVDVILAKGNKTSFMAKKGYCERSGFVNSLEGCNPLAISAVYDAVAGGAGELLAPDTVANGIAELKSKGLSGFQYLLSVATAKKLSAYSVFALLIALIMDLVIESGKKMIITNHIIIHHMSFIAHFCIHIYCTIPL